MASGNPPTLMFCVFMHHSSSFWLETLNYLDRSAFVLWIDFCHTLWILKLRECPLYDCHDAIENFFFNWLWRDNKINHFFHWLPLHLGAYLKILNPKHFVKEGFVSTPSGVQEGVVIQWWWRSVYVFLSFQPSTDLSVTLIWGLFHNCYLSLYFSLHPQPRIFTSIFNIIGSAP